MRNILNAPLAFAWRSAGALRTSIALSVAVVLSVNAMIFASPLEFDTGSDGDGPISSILGPLLPFIWIVWFVGMGGALHVITRHYNEAPREFWLIVLMLAACAAYPLYTAGFESLWIGLAANLIIAFLDGYIVFRLWSQSRIAALLILPIIPWLLFASTWIIFNLNGRAF